MKKPKKLTLVCEKREESKQLMIATFPATYYSVVTFPPFAFKLNALKYINCELNGILMILSGIKWKFEFCIEGNKIFKSSQPFLELNLFKL